MRICRAATIALALTWALPGTGYADEATVGEQIVDVMNQLFGRHPGIRANHAKGIVAEGSFAPSAAGAALSTAVLFQGGEIPVTVRFSDATGVPTIPDGDPNANPHGMAVRFHLPDGGEMDIVANSLAFFPVATGEEFRDLLQAVAASGPDAAKPTPLEQFLGSHPAALPALQSPATPSSFARETYNGVNAFVFVDAAGKRQPFRFRIDPVDGAEHLTAEDAAKQPPDYLIDELAPRLAQGAGAIPPRGPAGRALRPHRRRHQALARRPQAGRPRDDHGDQGRGRQRGAGQGAAVPADQPDRRDRAVRRPADRRAGGGLCGVVRAAVGVTDTRELVFWIAIGWR